jgi:uncharacterized membrane protein
MKSKYIGLIALFLLVSINLGASGYYYTVLPERIASEFDFAGEPKSWMTKGPFVIFNMAMLIVVPALLLSVAWISTKLPMRMVDLPNKEYWLAPERKAETFTRLFRSMLWLAVAIELFLSLLVGLVYWANLGHPQAMRIAPTVLLACFLLFMAGWLFTFYRKFKRVPKETS